MRFISVLVAALLPLTVYAQQDQGAPSTSMFGSVLPMMVLMFVIIYFLMIRPEQKKQKQRQKMINEMKKGDKVISVAGIYGVVQSIKGETVTVKIADNVNVEMTKSGVSNVVTDESNAKGEKVREKK